MNRALATLTLTALLGLGCGDVSRLVVQLRFPDADTEAATQQLLVIAREPPATGDPCETLWGTPPPERAELPRLLDYPNRADVVAAPLDVGIYTLYVYSYAQPLDLLCEDDTGCTTSKIGKNCRAIGGGKRACVAEDVGPLPIAGGCAAGLVDSAGRTDLTVPLEARPASGS
jgi:hypothetical protein